MKRRWVGGLAATLGLVVLIVAGAQCRSPSSSGSASPADDNGPSDPSAAVETAPTTPDPSNASDAAHDDPEPQDGSTFSRVAGRYAENDLRLVAEVQRITGAEPPASIDELIVLRRDKGADEAALRAHIDTEIEGLSLKVAARRWLQRELGGQSEPTHAPGSGAPPVAAPKRRPVSSSRAPARAH